MKKLLNVINNRISYNLDLNRFLIVGNAFNKRSIFLYRSTDKTPFLVVKIPENKQSAARCQAEYEALVSLSEFNIDGIESAKPAGIFEYENKLLYLQTTVISTPFLSIINPIKKRFNHRQFNLLTSALVNIYNSTKLKQKVLNKSYSLCFQHGDYWIGNLGLLNNNICLYDLEFSTNTGFPLYDLLHMGLYLGVVIENVGRLGTDVKSEKYNKSTDTRKFEISNALITRTFFDNSNLAKTMRICINTYLSKTGINNNDGIQLAKSYFIDDRQLEDLDFNWVNILKLSGNNNN